MGTRRSIAAALAGVLVAGNAAAADALAVAEQLGNVIGSEEACGLSYKQSAIQAFIEANVDDDDMEFPNYLRTYTWSAGEDLKRMSQSARTAQCTQVRRIAERHGFLD